MVESVVGGVIFFRCEGAGGCEGREEEEEEEVEGKEVKGDWSADGETF